MQIDGGVSSTLSGLRRLTTNSPSPADLDSSGDENASVSEGIQTAAASALTASSQDDAVRISAEGAVAAAQEGGADGATEAVDTSGNGTSAVKSFAYGTLGLERPDQPQEARNAFYTAGRWLAAGITLGGIISLLA